MIFKEIESNKNVFKSCFIPSCKNTTVTAPDKVYLSVPNEPLKRKAWSEAAGCPEKKLRKGDYACQDHFNLKEDLENYTWWKITGGKKRLRENAFPRFALQTNWTSTNKPCCSGKNRDEDLASTNNRVTLDSASDGTVHNLNNIENRVTLDSASDGTVHNLNNIKKMNHLLVEENNNFVPISYVIEPLTQTKCFQICPEMEHKYVQTKIQTYNKATETQKLPKTKSIGVICKILTDVAASAAVSRIKNQDNLDESLESVSSSNLNSSTYSVSEDQESTGSSELQLQMSLLKTNIFENFTKLVIEDNPLLFIGIPKDCMFVIGLIEEATSLSIRDIYLVLKKIRINLPFSALQYEFGVTDCQLSRIFNQSIHVIAHYLNQLIHCPSKRDILINLPLQFRFRYSNVHHIIDCFEIEIEKPSNPFHQTLTWSDYKKCNTAKYLIAVTPDGIAIFISKGACGRSTDMAIVEESGYLDKIPAGVNVLADRGFKQLDLHLQKRSSSLIRPPSVLTNVRSTKQEVRLTKQVASIRIHVERSINRIRDFKLLDIHSRVDNHFLDLLDSAVIIGWALVNLQTPIINQTE